jgi:heterodisulfide reductase subunit A2
MEALCPAIVPDNEAAALAVEFGIECDEHGFFNTLREKATSVESAVRGVYAAGACRTPMDIRSSVNEGQAASGRILAELKTGGMIDIPPTTATVDAMRCSGRMLCIPLCPYKAISSDSSTGKAAIIEELCRGCGICVSSCPAQAIEGRHFTSEELIAEIKGLLQEDRH